MRLLSILIMMLISFSSIGQGNQLKISISNCFSGSLYSYENDTIIVKANAYLGGDTLSTIIQKYRLSAIDSVRMMECVKSFIDVAEHEVFSNECVRDGFHFKIFMQIGASVKKIFVNNTYEARVDSLTSIFNKYFSKETWLRDNLVLNGMGYWDNRSYIEELIDDQKKCSRQLTKEDKQFYIQKFCEP